MSSFEWSLVSLLSSSIEQCESIEFMPLTSTDEYQVHCHCEENRYLCINVEEIRQIVNLCYSLIFSKDALDNNQLNSVTRVLLCCITECLTSWNIRRRLVLAKNILIPQELQFTEKLLYLRPKSEQLFRYRRWLIQTMNSIDEIPVAKEFEICTRASERHFINYASWSYRRWVVDYFHVDLDEELNRNRLWLETNISDSSGFSYRGFLLSRKGFSEQLIEQELKLDENWLKFYVDRESIWIYRQTLVFIALTISSIDRKAFLTKELDLVKIFPENFFSIRFSRLLNTLLSS